METKPAVIKKTFLGMRKKVWLFILGMLLLVVIAAIYLTNPLLTNPKRAEVGIVVDKVRLRDDVAFLTELDPPRNARNLPSLNQAAAYIKGNWEKLGLAVTEQKYMVGQSEYCNLLCSLGPEDGERIVVGAHYDVCRRQPGADDNASGVAGILELARLLKPNAAVLKSRVDLVAYTLEEPPFFATEQMGSYIHAKSLAAAQIKVKLMMSLEMIGYFSDTPGSQRFPVHGLRLLYPSVGNFIAVVCNTSHWQSVRSVKAHMMAASSVAVYSINAPEFVPGIGWSDHGNYWKFGYPALMVTDTSFMRNPNYHQPSDTIETLDFDKMAEVVKAVYWAIVNL